MSGQWEAFKGETERVQGQRVSRGVKGKAGWLKEPWLMRDIEALITKMEIYFGIGSWNQTYPLKNVRIIRV